VSRSRRHDLRRTVRRWGLRARLAVSSLVTAVRSSLRVRVLLTTFLVALLGVAVLGGYLSDRIRDGLFEQRVDQALEESALATKSAQATFSASPAVTGPEIQKVFFDLLPTLRAVGSGEKEVFLLRAPGQQTVFVNDAATSQDSRLRDVIPAKLRTAVRESTTQHWVPVAIPEDAATSDDVPGVGTSPPPDEQPGSVRPGLVIGSMVDVPAAGRYELYYLYDLSAEQETLTFIQQVLALASVGLLAFLVGIAWLVTRQVVHPVQVAARVAERLADGHLAERMTVRGADEIATLARSFNEMAESLQDQIIRMEELSRLQRRFVSDVSHELRTPLTTVRMAAEVIHDAKDALPPTARRSAELLSTQLDRFEALLADLLEISRFDAGAATLDAESRDVRDVVLVVVEQTVALAERRGVWLSVETPERPVVADIDPRRVERILRNLLVNAVEHAEGEPVEVRLAADSRALAITVRDHGAGLAPEEAEHVFDRFWRADPARARTTGGTGLGLAISLEDAHLHGGELEAWGRPGQGACFRLTLPRRAGLELRGSPLPLVPDDVTRHVPDEADGSPPAAHDPTSFDLDRMGTA